MRLYYFEGENGTRNFGDELNPYLWSRLLPDLDRRGSPDWQFVGIGTLLNDLLPTANRTIVFGTGVGYGKTVPKPNDSWRIYFVRGPRSASALGLPPSAGLTDPAILVASVWPSRPPVSTRYTFMPHWDGANAWLEKVCQDAGIGYIDPRWPVEQVLEAIGASGTLLCEAMHGAIVADTLRVPWIPVSSGARVLAFKWQDWCDSVGLSVPATDIRVRSGHPRLAARSGRHARGQSRQFSAISCAWIARTARPNLSSDRTWRRLLTAVEGKLSEFKADTELRQP